MKQNIPHYTSALIQLDMKPILHQKLEPGDASQFTLGAVCNIKYMGSEEFTAPLTWFNKYYV